MSTLAPPQSFDPGHIDGPPPVDEPDGGGGRGWVTLTQARNDIEAHLIMGCLAEAGVETAAVPQRNLSPSWAFGGSNPWVPVMVMVRRLQLDDARIALAEVALTGPSAAPRSAGSRGGWRAPVMWWVMALVLGSLFTALSYVRSTDAAERCRQDPICARSMTPTGS